MAAKILTPEPTPPEQVEKTIPERKDWKTRCWNKNPLNVGLANRLVKIDHVIDAVSAINDILLRDMNRAQEVEDEPESYVYDPLPWHERNALHIGVFQLLDVAEAMVQDIREDAYGICTQPSKKGGHHG